MSVPPHRRITSPGSMPPRGFPPYPTWVTSTPWSGSPAGGGSVSKAGSPRASKRGEPAGLPREPAPWATLLEPGEDGPRRGVADSQSGRCSLPGREQDLDRHGPQVPRWQDDQVPDRRPAVAAMEMARQGAEQAIVQAGGRHFPRDRIALGPRADRRVKPSHRLPISLGPGFRTVGTREPDPRRLAPGPDQAGAMDVEAARDPGVFAHLQPAE